MPEGVAGVHAGHAALDVGREFSPPKTIVFADREQIARLPEAREVPVRLSADVLAAEHLALVPFDGLVTDPDHSCHR